MTQHRDWDGERRGGNLGQNGTKLRTPLMPSFAVILPAAGSSSRFGDPRRKKPFIELKGRPVWVRSLELFISREDVKQSLIVLPPDEIDWFKEKFRANLAFMNVEIVAGGKERADSVSSAGRGFATTLISSQYMTPLGR